MDAVKGITTRMDSVLNGLQDEFKSLYNIRDFEHSLDALKRAGTRSDRSSKLRKLFDMFDACGIAYERGKENAYYEELVRNSNIYDSFGIEDRMLGALYNIYEEFPSPEEYMKRIVDRLCSADDGWENDTLRLRILKQFIKYGDYLTDAGFGGKNEIRGYVKRKLGKRPTDEEVLRALDDAVFSELDTAAKPQKKPEGKFGLLKTADDLATGKFRAEGATKKSLYLFAMVYGMTHYSGGLRGDEIFDPITDIEKNLFRDYYTNNLMRFISEVYRGRLYEYELDPSGQGINYKNFAEMIYLYYISSDYSPQDKIRLSNEMIERVQKEQFKKGKPEPNPDKGTAFYRGFFRKDKDKSNDDAGDGFDDKLNLSETEFEKFIRKYYDCDTFTGLYETKKGVADRQVGPFQLETEQNSAFGEYKAILDGLTGLGVSLEHCNYGLWFTDVAAFRKKGYETICDRDPSIDREKFGRFMDLLCGINNFMGCTVKEELSDQNENQEWTELSRMKTKALFVPSENSVTRTSLIVAYYYYHNALHEAEGGAWESFEEVFLDFKEDLDKRLERAFYQPLSGKNIFDLLVVFSSYAYLNL